MAITAATVLAANPDAQQTGEAYCELAMTGAIVAGVPPLWRREIASFLRGVLKRSPIASSDAYEPHRAVLGALVLELEMWAVRDAEDQPEPSAADLRDPEIVARERDAVRGFRDWADSEKARGGEAYRAHLDAIVGPGEERSQVALEEGLALEARAEALVAASSAPAPQPAPQPSAEEAASAIPDWL